MSSSTITIKPRRRTAKSPPPAKPSTNQNKETILLRNPLPKYSFDKDLKSRKAKKEHACSAEIVRSENETEKSKNVTEVSNVNKGEEKTVPEESVMVQISRSHTNGIGRLVGSFPQSMLDPGAVSLDRNELPVIMKMDNVESGLKDKPVNKVGPISKNSGNLLSHSVSDSHISIKNSLEHRTLSENQTILEQTMQSPQTGCQVYLGQKDETIQTVDGNQHSALCEVASESKPVTMPATQHQRDCVKCSERLQQLDEEKQLLKNQLEVQLQVNQELKKLLVASVGDDLQHRVERLTWDKAQMSMEIGDYYKKISDDYEHLDKISIQADMWRSKYLACRVMADELASSKAFYTMQYQECQMAVQKLLSERHQLRTMLYNTYRGLSQVQEAFDPLGSQTNSSKLLTSKNTIDLARTNQHLVEIIKYRLLPSHVTSTINNKMESDWHDYLTQAEAHAEELLSREMRPEDFRCLVPSRALMAAPGIMSVDRFHPCANYDNLTLNVCCKCKGEISVV